MINRQFNIKLLTVLGLLLLASSLVKAQYPAIGLDEALEIARSNYAGLERDRLAVEQQMQLASAGVESMPFQISVLGDEFDFGENSGIRSLSINQGFYLPKVGRSKRNYHELSAEVAQKQMDLTSQQLKREVEKAYYQLQYSKSEQLLVSENLELYKGFLEMTTSRLESGETGKIPQLAARSRHGQALLEQEHAEEQYQIALTIFNQWLRSDSIYDALEFLPVKSSNTEAAAGLENPHLGVFRARKSLAEAKVNQEKSKLLPSINTSLMLQTTNEIFPLFGYQVGMNVPVFRKAYKKNISAAEIGVKMEESALKAEEQYLERKISELKYRLEHQSHIIEYLENDLEPIVKEQSEVDLSAYLEGEIGYLEYLDGMEQVIKVKLQYLTALYTFNIIQVELDYWSGN